MRRGLFFKLIYVLAFAVVVFNMAVGVKNSLFFDIDELPEGTLLYSVDSPSKDKCLNIYLVDNVLGTGVRGEIAENGSRQNIFWQTSVDTAEGYWIDNEVVIVDGMTLNVNRDVTYDCRRGTSLFQEGGIFEEFSQHE